MTIKSYKEDGYSLWALLKRFTMPLDMVATSNFVSIDGIPSRMPPIWFSRRNVIHNVKHL